MLQPWYVKIIFGALVLIVIIVSFIFISRIQLERQVLAERDLLYKDLENGEEVIIEEDLSGLPEPVANWLDNIGVIGQNIYASVSFDQTGAMKLEEDQKEWYTPEARQYVNIKKPGYLWTVDIPSFFTKGRDLYHKGSGSMLIKLAGAIPVVNESDNYKINESSLHRFLLELPWYPTAALEDYMSWEEVDTNTVRGIITYQDMTADAIFNFGDDGELISMEAMRYKDVDEEAPRLKCIGEIIDYTEVEGMKIPHKINVSWTEDGEKFTWYKIENYNFVFNDYIN
ncbi:MAG: DUF6920 family protein [Bacillota bacterium]